MSKNAKKILAVALLLVVVAAAVFAYFQWGPPAQKRAAEAQRAEAAQVAEAAESAEAPKADEETAESESSAEEASAAEQSAEEAGAAEQSAERAEGEVTFTFTVIHGDGSEKEFSITTKELTLRKALEQEKLIEGTESEWGLYVLTVDGETADESKQQWWGYTANGEFAEYGVDEQPIADGDVFVFTLNEGW